MSNHKKKIIGKCCSRRETYLITYEGSPSFDETILVCKIHASKYPYNIDVKKIEKIVDE